MTRICTRSLGLAAVVVVALMTSSSDVKAAYNCSYSAAWTGSLQGTWDTGVNLTYNPDCLSRYVDFGDGQNDHTVVCGNANDPVTDSISHTYGSADSYYYYLYAGSLHQAPEGWWVYEGCIAAEGWMIVH